MSQDDQAPELVESDGEEEDDGVQSMTHEKETRDARRTMLF